MVVIALVSLTLSVSGRLPDFLTTSQVRVWNVYHYYLGAKYFEELGYNQLYSATLAADSEGEGYWSEIGRVRNLDSYEVERRGARTFDASASFQPDRWQEFKRDVTALSHQLSPRSWRGIFVDRGYNASPFWTVVGATLARWAPADRPLALKLLCSLDLPLLLATFWFIARTFGLRSMAIALLLFSVSPVNVERLVGGFLQYDWFCALAIGLCLYRRGRPATAAAAMSYAILTRIFPVLFVAAGLVPALRYVLRFRRLPWRTLRFAIALTAWCSLGLLLSLANGRGVDGWREFAGGIQLHKEHHLYGERRVGLQHLFTHELGSFDIREDRAERRLHFEHQRPYYLATAVALLALFAYVAWHQRSWAAQYLGLVPIFALLVTSRYYWSYLALLPLAGGRGGPRDATTRWLGGTQLAMFGAFYVLESGRGNYADYVILGALILAYLTFALLALSPLGRPAATRNGL